MLVKEGIFAAMMRTFVLLCAVIPAAFAQTYTLSGKVSDTAGHAVPSATVSAENVATGHRFSAQTGSDGMYSIHDLAGGDYMVSAVAGELQAPAIKVTLAAAQATDLTVSPAPAKSENPVDFTGQSEHRYAPWLNRNENLCIVSLPVIGATVDRPL